MQFEGKIIFSSGEKIEYTHNYIIISCITNFTNIDVTPKIL
jgi:hypothetical protein